jgi:nickel/cobalt transporter (NicO) family protein
MGLAGGIVPSPSALLVLLAAIALGRITFGIGLVVAYGIGLALTLIAAGLLLVHFESRLRRWSERRVSARGSRLAGIIGLLPLLSGLTIAGAGVVLIFRSITNL